MEIKKRNLTPAEIEEETNKALVYLGPIPETLPLPESNDKRVADWASNSFLSHKMAYNSAQGWLLYNGKHWQQLDPVLPREILSRMLMALSDQIRAGSGSRSEFDRIERLLSRARLTGITDLLSDSLYRDKEWFDRYRDMLNTNNGVVDLRSGETFPHNPDFGFTRVTSGSYWPEYRHPDWEQALGALDPESARYLKDRFGQAVTGYTPPDECLVFFMGGGSNGKSTIIEGSMAALGSFAVDVPEKLILATPSDHPVEKMSLLGARIAFLEELPDDHRVAVKRLKDLSRPTMTARDIAKSNITWRTSHTLFISTNYDSTVEEVDHGTWRRLIRIPFTKRFSKSLNPKDPSELPATLGLKERIISGFEGQHDAIVTWAIEGAVEFYARSQDYLPLPEAIEKATAAWRRDNDKLLEFFEDEIELAAGYCITNSALLAAFNKRQQFLGYRSWGAKTFGQRLRQHPMLHLYLSKPGRIRPTGPGSLVISKPHGDWYVLESAKQMTCWEGIRFKDPLI